MKNKLKIVVGAAVGAVVVIALLIVAGFFIAGKPSDGKVASHTRVAGIDVSNMTQNELVAALEPVANTVATEPVSIEVAGEGKTLALSPSDFGLHLDVATTAENTMQIGRNGNLLQKISHWLQSFTLHREAAPHLSFDHQQLTTALNASDDGEKRDVVEPNLHFNAKSKEMEFVDGKNGFGLNPKDAAHKLSEAAAKHIPISFELRRGEIQPRFTPTELEKTFKHFKAAYTPLPLSSRNVHELLDFELVQPALRSTVVNNEQRITADTAALLDIVEKKMVRSSLPVKESTFVVDGLTPVFQQGTNGSKCCDPQDVATVVDAITAEPEQVADEIELKQQAVAPKVLAGQETALGVTNKVATFTTNYPAGQPRVQNIHRIADMTKGTIIMPGEVFSLNALIGPRTVEKGFVEDHVIVDGKFATSVGGGISQFSTTLFNAAFFAGLEWTEYQSHSIYISRYPYGREATISFPAPDQKIKNITPYGVVIWATYTDTSVTVELWSTDYATGEQTGQTKAPRGKCTAVSTERTRHFVDGRTSKDEVHALYQPEEGVKC